MPVRYSQEGVEAVDLDGTFPYPYFHSSSNYLNQPGPPFTITPAQRNIYNSNQNHLLITASFGRILPDSFLELFPPKQRLNIHPSILPAYRGAAPIQHAIMNGERMTGVCVVGMLAKAKGIDAGRIWASQYTVRLSSHLMR
jgi:methionyl-tRNA formyltransferase